MTIKERLLEFGSKTENKCFTKEKTPNDFEIAINDLKNKFSPFFDQFGISVAPYLIITNKRKEEGGFFESDRTFEQTISFHQDFMVFWRHVDSTGWLKPDDYVLRVHYKDVLKADFEIGVEIGGEIVNVGKHTCLGLTIDAKSFSEDNAFFVEKLNKNLVLKASRLRLPDFCNSISEINAEMIDIINEFCHVSRVQSQSNTEILQERFVNLVGQEIITSEEINLFSEDYAEELIAIHLLKALHADQNNDKIEAKIKFRNAFNSLPVSKSNIAHINTFLFYAYHEFSGVNNLVDDQLEFLEKYGVQFLTELELNDDLNRLSKLYAINGLQQDGGNISELLIVNNDGISKRATTFTTLDKSNVPSFFLFPPGHPKSDLSYVRHPIITNRFIPIQNFEKDLFNEKVSEFSILIQALGAVEIEYLAADNLEIKSSINSNTTIAANAHTKVLNATLDIDDTNQVQDESMRNHGYLRRQTFKPVKKPHIPDNLIWFHHEPQWQNLARQRLYGNLIDHIEQISISETNTLNSLNQTKLNAEIKSVFHGISVEFETNLLTSIENSTKKKTLVKITFKPIEEFDITPGANKSESHSPMISRDNLLEIFNGICQRNGKLGSEGTNIFEQIAEYVEMDPVTTENGLKLFSCHDQ